MMEATAGATVQSWRPIMGRWRTLAKEISASGVVGAINVAVDLACRFHGVGVVIN